MTARSKEERRVIARRIYEALCERYPDRYVALVEAARQATPTTPESEIANPDG